MESINSTEDSGLFKVYNILEEITENKGRFAGVVTNNQTSLEVLTKSGEIRTIAWSEELSWARPYISENRRGAKPRSYKDILVIGDLVWLKQD